MKFLSLRPFIPSGNNFEKSKQLFIELGFSLIWDEGDYAGFERDFCGFILQKYDVKEFAENLMLTIRVDNVEEFKNSVIEKKLTERFGIKIGKIIQQSYGKEFNVIDIAGVCWHFVE